MKKEVTIYTDGACSGNPGPGGWGAILIYGKIEKEISGGAESTTNNRMELTAVIEALKLLKYPCSVTLYSDSQYVINGLEKGWAKKWKENNWVKSDKSKALNPDLWDTLLEETEKHEMSYVWVRGHKGDKYNEIADSLAVAMRDKYSSREFPK